MYDTPVHLVVDIERESSAILCQNRTKLDFDIIRFRCKRNGEIFVQYKFSSAEKNAGKSGDGGGARNTLLIVDTGQHTENSSKFDISTYNSVETSTFFIE